MVCTGWEHLDQLLRFALSSTTNVIKCFGVRALNFMLFLFFLILTTLVSLRLTIWRNCLMSVICLG